MEKNRLQQASSPRIRKSIEAIVKALLKQIDDAEGDIAEQIEDSPIWKEAAERMDSVPSVGFKTVCVLLGALPELGTLSRQRIGALPGLAPVNRDSVSNSAQVCCGHGSSTATSVCRLVQRTAETFVRP